MGNIKLNKNFKENNGTKNCIYTIFERKIASKKFIIKKIVRKNRIDSIIIIFVLVVVA